MLRSLVYRLLPLRCVVCELQPGAPATSICTQCEADFFAAITARCQRCAIGVPDGKTGTPRICGRCLASMPHFDATTTLADYVSPVDGMVMALKFTARLDLAQFFGRLLANRLSAMSPPTNDAVVMPVPLAFERARQRGFNQSHHIASAFALTAHRRLIVDRLLRVRHTPPQQSLALKERRSNVRGAFAVEGGLNGQHVFVVDDVMTTGSTLDEVARVLKQAGAAHVHNLIVARTP
jgi:ComF family protein